MQNFNNVKIESLVRHERDMFYIAADYLLIVLVNLLFFNRIFMGSTVARALLSGEHLVVAGLSVGTISGRLKSSSCG